MKEIIDLHSSLFKKVFIYRFLLLPIFILISYVVNSQSIELDNAGIAPNEIWETGLPFIQNYTPEIYQGFNQNWGAVKDSLGVMYFANGNGVLTYDGVNWEIITLPKKEHVKSITIDTANRVYVGALGEIGYLEPNSLGKLEYISLVPKMKSEEKNFSTVWESIATNDGIYFRTAEILYLWTGEEFKTWHFESKNLYKIYPIHDTIYLKVPDKGLSRMINGSPELVHGGEAFINDPITSITPFNRNELLIGTYNEGLLLYKNGGRKVFETKVDSLLKKSTNYTSITLPDNSRAFLTFKNGIVVMDTLGKLVLQIKKEQLLNSNPHNAFFDDNGFLWIMLNDGIAKIEYPSPFTYYGKSEGINDRIQKIEKFQNKIFVGTSNGLYAKKINSNSKKFTVYKSLDEKVWDIVHFKNTLLVATNHGVLQIRNNDVEEIIKEEPSAMLVSKLDPNRVFITTSKGLISLYYKDNSWINEGEVACVIGATYTIVEISSGDLWLETSQSNVWNIKFKNQEDAKKLKNPTCTKYGPEDGLPIGYGNIFKIKDKLYLTAEYDNEFSQEQLKTLEFNSANSKFIESKEIKFLLNQESDKDIDLIEIDRYENIWFKSIDENNNSKAFVAWNEEDNYKVEGLNQERISEMYGGSQTVFYEKENKYLWITGKNKLIKQSLNHQNDKNGVESFYTVINKIIYQNDSLLLAGIQYKQNIASVPFKNNQFRFEFASTSFYEEEKNQFQYMLMGFDEDWSSWTSEIKKDYTNIPEGDYTFKVRSKNIFNHIGDEDSYSFTILPPWHRTWWAYLIYGLLTIGIIWFFVGWRSKKLIKQNEKLEETIEERTIEIKHKNEVLNHQTEKLVELNESKNRLFSNISHEFRTPLTVILGMTDTLKTDYKNQVSTNTEKSLEMIRRNGKNLLHLVNELLDLAKVESGSMELELVQTDVVPFVKYFSESFHSLAESKKVNLTVYSEIDSLEMDVDINKLGAIISNLLSNAVKFTQENGKIIVHLNKIQRQTDQSLTIKVQDNGVGLAEKELQHLFNRFYQATNTSNQHQAGTGIGLSITKEFVELMKGEISVESVIGKGTTFTVQIPITNNAMKDDKANLNVEPSVKSAAPEFRKEISLDESNSDLPLLLIIEDNVDVASYLETCLKEKYQTIHALDGVIGMKMAFENIPDIIISDVMMPNMNGYEVCAALKEDERTDHIPIILLTAKVTTEDRLTGLTHGADAYLAKPFNQDELFTRLDQLILVRKKLINKLEQNGFSSVLSEKVENPQTKFVQQVIKVILTNLDNANFGPTLLAEEMSLSESQIYRKLKSITDKSTAVFIRSVRLQKAKELLQTSSKTVSEIAYEVGFNDPSWFSRSFKEEFGIPPSDLSK